MKIANNASGFGALNLSPQALENLKALGIHTPTPIQEQSIPIAMDGRDLFGIAQTGTGKTLAFALPIFENLEPGKQALVMAPTRELAEQIERTFWDLGFRTALLIGGAAMDRQVGWLRKKPPIIIATPGRLLDHLERRSANLKNISIVVLDEADRMLDIGFAPAIRRIMEQCPEERQTMLFSATLSQEVEGIALRHMSNPARVEIAQQGTTAENVEQELVVCEHERKHDVLKELMYENRGSMLVFTRTRHGARKIAKFTRDLGHAAVEIHSDRTLGQRREALEGFRSGRYRIMVATDVAARGIDVKEISMVVNFDVPEHAEDYVHRIGRTGRAGASGKAVTFVIPQQWKEVRDIEKLISMQIPDSPHSMLPLKRATEGGGRPRSQRNLSQRNKDRSHASRPETARVSEFDNPSAVNSHTFESVSENLASQHREERPFSNRNDRQPRDRNQQSRPSQGQSQGRGARAQDSSRSRSEVTPRKCDRREEPRNSETQEQKAPWIKSDFRPTPKPGSHRNFRPSDAPAQKKESSGEFTKRFDQKPASTPTGTQKPKFGTQFSGKSGPKRDSQTRDSGKPSKNFKRR
jgi:ATP-dependent RNA helicase RhlE